MGAKRAATNNYPKLLKEGTTLTPTKHSSPMITASPKAKEVVLKASITRI
jgi:hypothetical protein